MALILPPGVGASAKYSHRISGIRSDIDAIVIEAYCECEVFGAANGVHLTTRNGRHYQVFREIRYVTRVEAIYAGNSVVEERSKVAQRLVAKVKQARTYAEYAIAMPTEMTINDGEKTIVVPGNGFRKLYVP